MSARINDLALQRVVARAEAAEASTKEWHWQAMRRREAVTDLQNELAATRALLSATLLAYHSAALGQPQDCWCQLCKDVRTLIPALTWPGARRAYNFERKGRKP